MKITNIPIPPLAVQEKIVKVLDNFTELTRELATELRAELAARQKQYTYYRDQLFNFDPQSPDKRDFTVEWKTLGDVFKILAGGDKPKKDFSKIKTSKYCIPILSNGIDTKAIYGYTDQPKIKKPSLTISARGTIGWTSIREEPFYPIIRLLVLTPQIELNLKYAYFYLQTIEKDYKVPLAGIPQLTKPMIKNIIIPIPPRAEQERIVSILDTFDTLVNSISEGLPKEIELRQKQYEYYRKKLLSFKKLGE